MTPHHRFTLPPKRAKIVLKSVFLNKINTLSVSIFLSKKNYDPQYIWDPPSKQNDSALYLNCVTIYLVQFIYLLFKKINFQQNTAIWKHPIHTHNLSLPVAQDQGDMPYTHDRSSRDYHC